MSTAYTRLALTLAAVAALSACTIIPEPAQTRIYPLPQAQQVEPLSATYAGSVRVAQPSALQALDVPRLSVIRQDGRQAYWQDVRLQDRLPLVVQASLLDALSDAGVASYVVADSGGAAFDVELHSVIERFAIIENDQWQAHVRMRFQLQQGRDRRVVASRQFNAIEDLSGRDIGSAMEALSRANGQVQRELAAWLSAELN